MEFSVFDLNETQPQIPLSRLISGRAGYIDSINTEDNFVKIEGWSICLDAKNIELPHRVIVANDTDHLGTVYCNIERPDVIAAFNLNLDSRCGFKFCIPVAKVESEHMIDLLAEDSEGNLYQIFRIARSGLQLELTGRCNLRCPMCPSVSFSSFHKQDMTLDDLDIIAPLLRKIDNLCFDGFGEALLSPYFDNYICAVPRLKELIFHTNGLLLNKKTKVILENSPPLRSVIVSIDSLIPETYEVIRRGSNQKKVLQNINDFIKLREANNLHFPKVIPNITIMNINCKELEDFVRFASELDGIVEFNYMYDPVKLDEKVTFEDKWKFNYEEQKPKNSIDKINQYIKDALRLAKQLEVIVKFSGSYSGMLEETVDEFGYVGIRKPLKECQYMQPYYMLQANGRFQYCVWQTSSVYDWRKTRNVDPFQDLRGMAVWNMIKKGIIPSECGGAGCMWVGRRPSEEPLSKNTIEVSGGWSGKRGPA